jgi:quercetin dioxygenase-like cupin family protein
MKKTTLLASSESGVCSLLHPAQAVENGIVSQAVLTTPSLRLTLMYFAAGQELSEHNSKARALVQVLSGTCSILVGEANHSLKAGDLLHLPPGAPHAVTANDAFSMLLTQITESAG